MAKKEELSRGTLNEKEPHPAIGSAFSYFKQIPLNDLMIYQESFSSCAIEGNRLAEICSETLDRLLHKKPVSDRYFLGLMWAIRNMREDFGDKEKE